MTTTDHPDQFSPDPTNANLFRKRPVVIAATQWFKNGDHPLDYSEDTQGLENGELRVFTGAYRKSKEWEGYIVRYFRRPGVSGQSECRHCGQIMHLHGWIDTLGGGHIVCPGDWIITGVHGEHYPCKPAIFAATYEPFAGNTDRISLDRIAMDGGASFLRDESWTFSADAWSKFSAAASHKSLSAAPVAAVSDFEALLDAADEWAQYVEVDTAPMTLRKYLERAIKEVAPEVKS